MDFHGWLCYLWKKFVVFVFKYKVWLKPDEYRFLCKRAKARSY